MDIDKHKTAQVFASRLTYLLYRSDMSQSDLARKANIQPSTISYYICNRRKTPHAETLRRIAVALGVSSDYLIGLTDDLPEQYREEAKP